jgi:[ribosomal protein S5]-alanine N-acetyltransferase
MKTTFETDQLVLTKVSLNDAPFIRELVNTPGWLQFIGERNIKTIEDAEKYIEKLLSNSNLIYWVVKLQLANTSLGIISFIKRDYLDHYDIGFAFMPQYTNKGYAFEASKVVLNYAIKELKMAAVVATTLQENSNSIRLLEKLGLHFEKKIKVEKEELLIYSTEI